MNGAGDFWARRRAGVAAEAEAEKDAEEAQALAQEHAALEELSEDEVLAALDLPNPDAMTQGDDFTVFMAKAVPDAIRRRALRTLWRSNPVLANVDMLVDYGDDFTDAATVVENIQTAYQVGKGMLKHVEEMARKAAEQEIEEENDPEPQDVVPDDVVVAEVTPESEALPEPPAKVALENVADEVQDGVTTPMPRRMKFRLEETA